MCASALPLCRRVVVVRGRDQRTWVDTYILKRATPTGKMMMQQQHVPPIFLTRPMITSCDADVLSVIVHQFDCPDGMASYDGVVSLLKTCHHFHKMKDMSWIKDLLTSWYYREFRAAMNLRSWPASCGGHFPHIAFYWQPPSTRTLQRIDNLKMYANCPNELCARYGGDPDKNIPPGACYSILDPLSVCHVTGNP